MPDDAAVGLTTVAADELEFVNGVAQTEPLPKAQRVRPVHGPDGAPWDTSDEHPLPVSAAGVVAALVELQAELAQKLEAGQAVALDAASLAALEQVTATLSGAVALDAATVGALTGAATPAALPGASGAVTSADGRLMGFSVREAAATPAAAAMRLRAGGAAGTILATVTLSAGESVRDWFGPNGIQATGGVYYELVSGTITGGVQTR